MSISTDKSQAGAVDTFHKGPTHTKSCQTLDFCEQTHSAVSVFNKALCVARGDPSTHHIWSNKESVNAESCPNALSLTMYVYLCGRISGHKTSLNLKNKNDCILQIEKEC